MNILSNRIFVGVLVSSVLSVPALAGEVLRLKAGEYRTRDRSHSLFIERKATEAPGYFVIQFVSAITAEDQRQLESWGLQLKGYLPDDALIVRGSSAKASLFKDSSSRVRAVLTMAPEWKLSETLSSASVDELLWVTVGDAADLRDVIARIESIPGVSAQEAGSRDLLVQGALSRLLEIAAIPAVEWIDRVPVLQSFVLPVDPAPSLWSAPELTGYESGTKLMGFEAAWSRGFKGEGQIVAVADTGLDTGIEATLHADFGSFVKGFPIGLGTRSWHDPQGHGTHVAGSVAGDGKSSQMQLRGGAFEAGLMAESLWSPILDNLAPGTDFDRLIGTVHREGARIQTNSWGSPMNLGAYDTMAMKVDEFMWKNPDMLVLFAAGNSGEDKNRDGRVDEGSISSPGTAKNILTVGASENLLTVGGIQNPLSQLREGTVKWGVEPLASDLLSDNPNGIAGFSSRGPTRDGRLKPEIVAPGTNIVSTRSKYPGASPLWGEYDANYVYAGGTSMSTPLTAGAAAVAREYLVKARGQTNPSAALVKATLVHTAYDLFPGQFGRGPRQELPTQRPNVHEGYGRVDMDQVTSLGEETVILDDTVGLATGEVRDLSFEVGQGKNLRVTLAYTDAPGSTAAAKALVNDLDIQVVTPDGRTLALGDRTNNLEMIELAQAPAGSYQIRVKGVNVPQGHSGRQPFALLIGQY